MGQILQNWRIMGAMLAAAVIIGGAYMIGRIESPSVAQASSETALLAAAAAKDSTGDGLPDWQKVLYGIPLNATTTDYFNLGMTDGEAVAKGLIVPKAVADVPAEATSTDQGTLTDSFSKAFFTLYLSAKDGNGGADLSASQTQALANEAFTHFIENFAPAANEKKQSDLKIAGSGSGALADFAGAAEGVFNRYQSATHFNEFEAVKNSLASNDPAATAQVASAAAIYRKYAVGLAALTVPSELAAPELDLINAFFERADIYDGIAKVASDPLMAIVSLQELSQNETAWMKALADMGTQFTAEGVIVPVGQPGAGFITLSEKLSKPYAP